ASGMDGGVWARLRGDEGDLSRRRELGAGSGDRPAHREAAADAVPRAGRREIAGRIPDGRRRQGVRARRRAADDRRAAVQSRSAGAERFSGRRGAMVDSRTERAMPRIDVAAVAKRKGTGYPAQFNAHSTERPRQRLGDAGGLKDFGVNLMHLPPGNWSAQRHWHSHEDEFVYVLEGVVVLVEDGGET